MKVPCYPEQRTCEVLDLCVSALFCDYEVNRPVTVLICRRMLVSVLLENIPPTTSWTSSVRWVSQ